MENMVGQTQTVQVPNYSGVNIQIFNPSVAAPGATVPPANVNTSNYTVSNPSYPANYYTQNFAQPAQSQLMTQPIQPAQNAEPAPTATKKPTESKDVVELTDDYIKTLESYLNDQNKEVRLIAAKEVLQRLQEDDSRKDDEALNALVNKMLQDPSQSIRFIAMAALESRAASGNNKSLDLLQNIKNKKTDDGQDSLKASKILLGMTAPVVRKEVTSTYKQKKQ